MNSFDQLIWQIAGAIAGTLVFMALGRFLFGQGKSSEQSNFVGALPFLGSLAGTATISSIVSVQAMLALAMGAVVLSLIGLLRDRFKVGWQSIVPVSGLVIAGILFLAFESGTPAMRIMNGVFWALLIIFSLKIASLVYEMPFILLGTSGLAQFVYFAAGNGTELAVSINISLMIAALLLLTFAAGEKRYLIGNSGLFCAGFLLAAVSQIEASGSLLIFALFIPSMVVLFPFALISSMILVSYFGNRLHRPSENRERQFSWSLQREQTVIFSGIVFLCLNFFGLLTIVEAPGYAYFSLFLLLTASLFVFFKTFARRISIKSELTSEIEIFGIRIDAVLPGQVLQKIEKYIGSERKGIFHIITADSLALVRSQEEDRFRSVMQRAELVVPDGAGVVWAADFLGCPLPGRVPGVALVGQICEKAAEKGWRIFFLGGRPGIADQAADIIRSKSPDINICGIEHGYFAPESDDEQAVIEKLKTARPDMIFVALGVPRQEWFITRLRDCLEKSVAIGVGGSFDVISNTLPRAPVWMQQCGIEWLFRLWLEPARAGRMLKIPVFVLQVLREKWKPAEARKGG